MIQKNNPFSSASRYQEKIRILVHNYCDVLSQNNGEHQQLLLDVLAKEILKAHPYVFTKLPDGRWQTYLRDPNVGKRFCIIN